MVFISLKIFNDQFCIFLGLQKQFETQGSHIEVPSL